MKKAVVDTNVFVSAFTGGTTTKSLYEKLRNREFLLITSHELLTELLFVLSRPKFKISSEEIEKLAVFLHKRTYFVTPQEKLSVCRDPEDDKILECAAEGKPDFIVTGDEDLLVLDTFRGIPILRPNEFLARLKL